MPVTAASWDPYRIVADPGAARRGAPAPAARRGRARRGRGDDKIVYRKPPGAARQAARRV